MIVGPTKMHSQRVGVDHDKRFSVGAVREATLSPDLSTVIRRRLLCLTLKDARNSNHPAWEMTREEMRVLRESLDRALLATAGDLEEDADGV